MEPKAFSNIFEFDILNILPLALFESKITEVTNILSNGYVKMHQICFLFLKSFEGPSKSFTVGYYFLRKMMSSLPACILCHYSAKMNEIIYNRKITFPLVYFKLLNKSSIL